MGSGPFAERPSTVLLKTRWDLLSWGVLVVLLGMLYASTLPGLWRVWQEDANYGHCLAVPFLAAFILWRQREKLREAEPTPYGPGFLVLGLGLGQYLLGIAGNEDFTVRSSLIVVLLGISLTLWGKRRTKPLLFPVLYLLMMIPIPYILYYEIANPLQLLATKWSVYFVDLLRLSAYREGNIIYLPNTTLEVEYACSGLRSLMALITFGLLFAYFAQPTKLTRMVLVASIFPIAIISNLFRIVVTVVLAYYKGPELAKGFLHEASGIVVYTVASLLILGVNDILRRFFSDGTRAGTMAASP